MRLTLPIALGLTALIAGCATSPGGNISESLLERQRGYCTETSPATRAVALAVIRSQVPGYPVSGLCTDAEQALAEEIARQIADLPAGAVIDIEQAREDQRRFEEMTDAGADPETPQD